MVGADGVNGFQPAPQTPAERILWIAAKVRAARAEGQAEGYRRGYADGQSVTARRYRASLDDRDRRIAELERALHREITERNDRAGNSG